MSQIIKPVALDETVVITNGKLNDLNQTTLATNDKLNDIKTQIATLAAMPEQIRSVLSDYSSGMQTILGQLPTNVRSALMDYADAMGRKFDTLASNLDSTMTTLASNLDSTMTEFASDMGGKMERVATVQETEIPRVVTSIATLADELVGVLASVKSVNGKTGAVELDSTELKINRTQQNSKTIGQMLTEMNTAIEKTPLSFSATKIADTDADYMVTVTVGTPA